MKSAAPRATTNKAAAAAAGKGAAIVDNRAVAVAQRQMQAAINTSPRQVAQRQQAEVAAPRKNTTGLPDDLKAGVENLSGYSLDDVKVHYNSAKPAQLQAHAYAQGTDIHVAPGQEQHLPHEAWHVVQQKQGRVKATMQMKGGVNVNDNAGLEKEADRMGRKALQNFGSKAGDTTKISQAKRNGNFFLAPIQRVKITKAHEKTILSIAKKFKYIDESGIVDQDGVDELKELFQLSETVEQFNNLVASASSDTISSIITEIKQGKQKAKVYDYIPTDENIEIKFIAIISNHQTQGRSMQNDDFEGIEKRDVLKKVHYLLIAEYYIKDDPDNATEMHRPYRNKILLEINELITNVLNRINAQAVEAAKNIAFQTDKNNLLLRPDVLANPIVLAAAGRIQRIGNMVNAVIEGEFSRAQIRAAVVIWNNLADVGLIKNFHVPDMGHIGKKKRGEYFEYNKNLVCNADSNPNNFHINADATLRNEINNAHPTLVNL